MYSLLSARLVLIQARIISLPIGCRLFYGTRSWLLLDLRASHVSRGANWLKSRQKKQRTCRTRKFVYRIRYRSLNPRFPRNGNAVCFLSRNLTICPCCGFKFVGALSNGCRQCGARAVGEPLPRPAHELPSYGRAVVLAVAGSLTVLFSYANGHCAGPEEIGSVGRHRLDNCRPDCCMAFEMGCDSAADRHPGSAASFTVRSNFSLKSSVVSNMRDEDFCVVFRRAPDCRVDRSDDSRAPATTGNGEGAAYKAYYYTFEAALLEYQAQYPDVTGRHEGFAKTHSGSLARSRKRCGTSILATVEKWDFAAVGGQKSASLRGAAIRKASLSSATDDTQSGGLAFTTYELQLPGDDKILGNEDDWIAWNGGSNG